MTLYIDSQILLTMITWSISFLGMWRT